MTKTKRNTLLFLVLFELLVIVVAMSLPRLVLAAGQPFSLGQQQPLPFGTIGALPHGELIVQVIRGALAVALVLLPFSLVYMLMTRDGRRRLLMYVALIIVILLVSEYLRNRQAEQQPPDQTTIAGAIPNQLPGESPPTSVFTPTPPSSLVTTIALVIAIIVVGLLIAAVMFLRRKEPPASSLQRLADEVQNAIDTLQTGGDLKTTIIRCYQEMSRVVQEEKGVERQITMTPREFEDQLVRIGLPHEPIKTLTELFERVRYGNTTADPAEENLALACLTNIVEACRGKVVAHEA